MKGLTDRALTDMRATSSHVLRTSSILQAMKGTQQVTVQSMYSAFNDKLRSYLNQIEKNNIFETIFEEDVNNARYPSGAVYRVVRLVLTATDLPNLEKMGKSDPYFKIYGYNGERRGEQEELLYTSEVVSSRVDFVEWKPAFFGIPKSHRAGIFKVFIFDKEMFGKDQLIAGPVDVHLVLIYLFGREQNEFVCLFFF